MTERQNYAVGPDIPVGEVLRDGAGRRVDDAYVESAVAEARRYVRGRGRPSLSRKGESPLLRVRISTELDEAVRAAADAARITRAEWVREVLDHAARRAG